jgi:hypothetical protein
MRVGATGFCTEQGLGFLLRDFVKHGIVTDVALIRHGKRPERPDWYPQAQYYNHRRVDEFRNFIEPLDAMLFFETPFCWELISYCRSLGKPTILMPMLECMPEKLPQTPDVLLCPSLLELSYYRKHTDMAPPSVKICHIPVPVAVPWRERHEIQTFIHNAGHGGLNGRNGTAELLAAWKYVKSPAKLIVRTQDPLPNSRSNARLMRTLDQLKILEIVTDTLSAEELYAEGDAFVFPEKFNGLSLPLQEAYASGMPVIATNRFPISAWLPRHPLVDPIGYRPLRVNPRCVEVQEAILDPKAIAAKIDDWYGRGINELSKAGKRWAEQNSWEALKPLYHQLLETTVRECASST